MPLFPSWSHNYKMLHSFKDCIKFAPHACRMFGEFCILATELSYLCEQRAAVPMSTTHSLHCDGKDTIINPIGSKRMAYEVFLGGSCNPTTWRSEIAIPALQSLGITYYNPQVAQWGPELIAQEYEAKQTARVLLFVIDNQTRNSAGIIEAAQLAATRSDSLILVIYPYHQGQMILGEAVSTQEYHDLTNGLLVLQYLLEKQRIPIFDSVSVALNCTSRILREGINVQDLDNEDGIRPTRISLNQNGTDFINLRDIFKSLDVNDTGTISLRDAWVTFQSNTKCNMSDLLNAVNKSESYRGIVDRHSTRGESPSEQRINFEQFCILASEFPRRTRSNGVSCESEILSVWSILCRKASKFLHSAFVHPLNRFLDWSNYFKSESETRNIYIGIVGKDLLWLESSVTRQLESLGLTYHQPSANDFSVRILPQELQRMKNSQLILLIVPQHSRGTAVMALAAYLIGLRTKLVLCVQPLPDDCIISGEKLSEQATKDYNRGRMYLADYATREGVPVFQNVADALQRAIQLVQSPC